MLPVGLSVGQAAPGWTVNILRQRLSGLTWYAAPVPGTGAAAAGEGTDERQDAKFEGAYEGAGGGGDDRKKNPSNRDKK